MQQSHHITDTSGLLNILSILIVTRSFLNLMSQMVCYSEPILGSSPWKLLDTRKVTR